MFVIEDVLDKKGTPTGQFHVTMVSGRNRRTLNNSQVFKSRKGVAKNIEAARVAAAGPVVDKTQAGKEATAKVKAVAKKAKKK